MSEEVAALVAALSMPKEMKIAGRKFHSGNLFGQPSVVVESRWGKVAAAVTAAHLISTFSVDAVIFLGVAGAVDPTLRVGDIIIANELYQHDMDASPIFAPLEIPALGRTSIAADAELQAWLRKAAETFVQNSLREDVAAGALSSFGIDTPRVIVGDIATGDRFFSSPEDVADLRTRVPSALCVEMEGAAVAQTCFEHGIPFGVVRTISDSAGHSAGTDFQRFITRIAGQYSLGITRSFIMG